MRRYACYLHYLCYVYCWDDLLLWYEGNRKMATIGGYAMIVN